MKLTKVVENSDNFSRRVRYFFESKSQGRYELRSFIDELSCYCDVYIFGGLLRDVALGDAVNFSSDIDLVFTNVLGDVDNWLDGWSPQKNKFGGRRIVFDRWIIDVWKCEDTWAFKHGSVPFEGVKSLLDTTITNWDAVLYQWSNKKLIYKDEYLRDLQDGFLDVILNKNPNRSGMYAKILRCYLDKHARLLSPEAADLILSAISESSFEDIYRYEMQSYGKSYISKSAFYYLKNNAEISEAAKSMLPISLIPAKLLKQKELFD